MALDLEIIEYPFRGFTAFENGGNHQIGSPDHIAAGKNFLITRLVLEDAIGWSDYTAALIQGYIKFRQPVGRTRLKTEGDYHSIGGNYFFRSCNWFRPAAPTFIRFTQLGCDYFYALDAVATDNFYRLPVPQEMCALFFGVSHFAA